MQKLLTIFSAKNMTIDIVSSIRLKNPGLIISLTKLCRTGSRIGASDCYYITIHTNSDQEIFVDTFFSRYFTLAKFHKNKSIIIC